MVCLPAGFHLPAGKSHKKEGPAYGYAGRGAGWRKKLRIDFVHVAVGSDDVGIAAAPEYLVSDIFLVLSDGFFRRHLQIGGLKRRAKVTIPAEDMIVLDHILICH